MQLQCCLVLQQEHEMIIEIINILNIILQVKSQNLKITLGQGSHTPDSEFDLCFLSRDFRIQGTLLAEIQKESSQTCWIASII